ncbi:MAG: DUF3531 family protein [Limnoraphis robusta]|uniref:DUF3531 domain-containing protein n=1 Tax=Limnoraphis robusta CS-951 TaxID=1637645 RepID=A0A0F5Y9M0_9CYAN|nr:DUF3531 family protein [Limnoraphis robusta]KKD35539.1 hypothetical protein WN50_24785 [Limnoraphis robusta CS-951]KMW69872.1 hypothetical protein WN50_39885 [Limnoraphis robusta CS-951]MEA5501078.1 DUF3531 family protein [Limnoraphis robusta BA-68 BA1]
MDILFRECNPFDLWIWLRFSTVPSMTERQYIEEVFDSWFLLGKLGGFNAENLQVQECGVDLNYMTYDTDSSESSMMALMHNMGEIEYQGLWVRCWFDLGTTDSFSLDILINAFQQLSKEYVTIEELIIGGQNEDWPVDEDYKNSTFADYN